MAEPEDMILPMLREVRAEQAAFRSKIEKDISEVQADIKEGFRRVEAAQKNIRSALAGETVFSRMIVGEFEERLVALENDIKALAGQK